ncbi:DNA primase [Pedomonas mirosovicensis]|uniref:DNA primase n=1 Tax=Pedomonas mirosovicensis TaxID=2908641 RepID=UPI002168E6C1|nr:DNA primase [Pedomonas mirosovicensis]MCH8685500.1 DNA primase [Pedomonas mirosovicensis]
MSISPAFLDEIRARVAVSAVVGRKVKLQRAGREWKGCCPFHNEKTPSFYVNDEKAFYHCFGCGAHGDVIRFLCEAEGRTFPEAVEQLANEAGLEMPRETQANRAQQERLKGLLDVMAAAQNWFAEQLHGIAGADARNYLQRRGLLPETVRRFGLGFAPEKRDALKTALIAKGASEALLIEAGLIIAVEDRTPYDRFRNRLMFPIRDGRGRIIAFGGRILGDGQPKYLNSPDTPLFDKGRTLYNLDLAAGPARKSGRLFVVEGYMDVITLAQAGIEAAVAPLGTALTEEHLRRLWRITPEPLLCFDGDSAGQRAAVRAAHRALPLLEAGKSLRFITLPEGQDPDDLVRGGGADALNAIAAKAEPLVDLLWRSEMEAAQLMTPEGRAALRQSLMNRASAIADRPVQELYRREFLNRFDQLTGRSADRQWGRDRQAAPGRRPGAPWAPPPRVSPGTKLSHQRITKPRLPPMIIDSVGVGAAGTSGLARPLS